MSGLFCSPTPPYRAADGAAPAPASGGGGFLARLFGCGREPVYQAPPLAITTPSQSPEGGASVSRRRARAE